MMLLPISSRALVFYLLLSPSIGLTADSKLDPDISTWTYRAADAEKDFKKLMEAMGRLAEASHLIEILERDNSTLVFPYLLKEIHGDLKTVEANLSKADTTKLTQLIQADIEKSLKAMLAALKEDKELRASDERQKPTVGGGP